MKRLLLEVQAEKERLIRSLAAGSIENMISPQQDLNPESPHESDSVFQQSIISPIKNSIPRTSSQSMSDIGASASQVKYHIKLFYSKIMITRLEDFLIF
jgi:hypothetical protein